MRPRMFLLLTSALALIGCSLRTPSAPTQAPTAAAESAWQSIADGMEWRTLLPNGDELAQIVVIRIEPGRFRFRAIYREGDPQSLAAWRALEPSASLIINANFFDRDHRVLGVVVSDGIRYGAAYSDRGGLFVQRSGSPTVTSTLSPQSQIDSSVQQAIQGFPLLVDQGQPAYVGSPHGERNRRTLIAEDKSGNILIMVSPFLGLSLHELSAYLPETGLEIVTAVNLDGGGSTMLALPAADYFLPSFDAVPDNARRLSAVRQRYGLSSAREILYARH